MGYLFLFIALLAGATKGFCGKKTSGYLNGIKDSMLANIIRMLLCIVIGLVMIFITGDPAELVPTWPMLLIGALSGVSTSVFVVTWLISVKRSAYMMLDVFLMLGTLIPLISGSIFFHEAVKWTQWLGIAVLFVAVLLMCSYNNSIKEKITLPAFLILLASGVANGITDFSQKLFVKTMPGISASAFNFYTYIFAALTLIIAYFLFKTDEPKPTKETFTGIFGYVLVMAICLFANSYFKTLAADRLDAVLLYPLNQGAALILSSAMSALLFKEKLTPKAIGGIMIAFAGLIIINVI